MLLTKSLTLASTITAGIIAPHRKKKSLRLADALTDGEFKAPTILFEKKNKQHSISKVQAKLTSLAQEIIAPIVGQNRLQQLNEITGNASPDEDPLQKEMNRNLVVSSASLLFIAGGSLLYAPLYVPGLLGAAYTYSFLLKKAYETVVHERRLNGDVLISIVTMGSIIGGFYFAIGLAVWQGAVMRWLLAKTNNHSRKGLVNLLGEQPRSVWIMAEDATGDIEVEIPFERLQVGDQVVVVAGQMIPVDGAISAGIASIDQHMLTGEGQPAEKSIGESVFASTVMLSGRITVRVEQTGSDTVAAQMGHILNNTADFNLSIRSKVESFLRKVVPGYLILSAACLPWIGLNRSLAVLWGMPAYRMFVLGPMSMLNYLHLLSGRGILIKDGRSLEHLNDVDTVVFDKTGTLTTDMPVVSQVLHCSNPSGALSQDALLTYAAAAEFRQTHPVALAILQAADIHHLEIPQIDHAHYEIGYGVKVNLNDQVIRVGSDRFMEMCDITIPTEIQEQQARCHKEGYSLVYVAIDEQLGGAIELRPTVRPETKEVIQALSDSGKTLYIISGDNEAPTRRLAQELGIDHYFANTLPEHKAALVKQLQEEGRSVCFIGDGINDAIALKQANVSISLRGATTIATDTAQIVLMDGDLSQLPTLFSMAKEFNENLNRSFMMTIVPETIGLACTFFFGWGLLTAVVFNVFCWVPQLGSVMLPLIKYREKDKPRNQSDPLVHIQPNLLS